MSRYIALRVAELGWPQSELCQLAPQPPGTEFLDAQTLLPITREINRLRFKASAAIRLN
jgi:hypothetical protein